MAAEPIKPLNLFYCYAREDKALRDELDNHLSLLKRQHEIISWSDGEIIPGIEWKKEIDTQLNSAHIILLLVSASFLASDYCYGVEMKRALERHTAGTARVIPIILRRVYWEGAPFAELQALPTGAKPVTQWQDRDEAFWDVTVGISKAIKDLRDLLKAKEWLDEGNRLRDLERYEAALEAYEQAIHLNPNYAPSWNSKGIILCNLKHDEEALKAYEQAIRLNPNYDAAWHNKGNTLRDLERYEEALEAYKQAIHLDPSYAPGWNATGNVLCDLKRYEEALEAYKQAIHLDPNNTLVWSSKGNVLCDLKRYEEALEAYEQAIRLNPDFTSAWYDKGLLLLYYLNHLEEALSAFEQVLHLDPDFIEAWYNKGITLSILKRYDEALAAYEHALHLDPNHPLARSGKEQVLAWQRPGSHKPQSL